MGTTKIGDVVVKVGEYERDGQKKGEYENIGAWMEDDEGRPFLLINNSALNPSLAMIANRDRKRRIIVSLFREEGGGEKKGRSEPPAQGNSRGREEEDQIPF